MPRSQSTTWSLPWDKHVLGRVQPLFDRRTTASLEQDRSPAPTGGPKQRKVLHVPGADLEHVRVARDQRDLLPAHHLGDDRQTRLFSRLREELEPFGPQPLKVVG